jgi:hypothetical protein
MKLKFVTAIALCAMAIISCDEDTGTLGDSLTSEGNKLIVTAKNYNVLTSSMQVDSVYSRERQCYVGKVLDPETGTYVKSEFTTQFNMMEYAAEELPKKESILDIDENGEIRADSSFFMIYFDVQSSYGDTLTPMKLRVSELDKPITGINARYTNFNPRTQGYLRADGLSFDKMFTIRDLNRTDSIRYLVDTNLHRTSDTKDSGWYDYMRIWLNDPYTDKNGKKYPNYGTYILRTFYDHPEYFKNSFAFINNVCPGFHFETVDGTGVMAKIKEISLYVFFNFNNNGRKSTNYLMTTSTEEVVQTTTVSYDKYAIKNLVDDNSCTYIKSPAAIFTEVELPVDEICTTHPSDSILSAKVSFNRINNTTDTPEMALTTPSNLLLIEKDSLNSFFLNNSVYNNSYAYNGTLSKNAYSYSNISNLVTRMYNNKVKGMKSDPNWTAKHPNWNKALLVPVEEVTVTSSSYGSTTSSTIALKNKMGLSSTRLKKGSSASPINIEVIYAKFND